MAASSKSLDKLVPGLEYYLPAVPGEGTVVVSACAEAVPVASSLVWNPGHFPSLAKLFFHDFFLRRCESERTIESARDAHSLGEGTQSDRAVPGQAESQLER